MTFGHETFLTFSIHTDTSALEVASLAKPIDNY